MSVRRLIKWTGVTLVALVLGVVIYTNYYIATFDEKPVYESDFEFHTNSLPSTAGSAVHGVNGLTNDPYTPVPDGGHTYTDTGIDYSSGFENSYINGSAP